MLAKDTLMEIKVSAALGGQDGKDATYIVRDYLFEIDSPVLGMWENIISSYSFGQKWFNTGITEQDGGRYGVVRWQSRGWLDEAIFGDRCEYIYDKHKTMHTGIVFLENLYLEEFRC